MSSEVHGKRSGWLPLALTVVLACLGTALAFDSALRSSATYDEVTYLKVGADWWRHGNEDAITRMGSPSLFWKLQQSLPLWALDRAGFGHVIEEPERFQAILLPIIRIASLPIWIIALATTAVWARWLHGPNAMVMASALFALSPNLLAHAPLATMELPLIACTVGVFFSFFHFLDSGSRISLVISSGITGVALSCKYTTVLFLPILAILWWINARGERNWRRFFLGSLGFLSIAGATNLAVTGFSLTSLSPNRGGHGTVDERLTEPWKSIAGQILEIPVPREIAGFATQTRIQKQGGASYLFGERREQGWWYYYLVTLIYKLTPAFWFLFGARCLLAARRTRSREQAMIPIAILAFLVITLSGSTRNFGVRYLLPLAPLAIVWVSALAESGRVWSLVAALGILAQAGSVFSTHPHELSYFPRWAGGAEGGRFILADSNLDWGQGLKGLARLQGQRPEFADMTVYYFGNTDPVHYGVKGRTYVIDASSYHPCLPASLEAKTRYLAVSTSLQFGPWGPLHYFRPLDNVPPEQVLPDGTMAIYDLRKTPLRVSQ